MGLSKNEIYPEDLVKIAELLKATSHPARLKALLIIANSTDEDVTATDIKNEIKLSQASISQHLKQLRDVGLLKTRVIVKDKKNYLGYVIDRKALSQIEKTLNHLIKNTDLKYDETILLTHRYFSKLQEITNWDQCFET